VESRDSAGVASILHSAVRGFANAVLAEKKGKPSHWPSLSHELRSCRKWRVADKIKKGEPRLSFHNTHRAPVELLTAGVRRGAVRDLRCVRHPGRHDLRDRHNVRRRAGCLRVRAGRLRGYSCSRNSARRPSRVRPQK